MTAPSEELLAWLDYRSKAIAIGQLALRHAMSWEQVPSMQIRFDDRLVIEGLATGFTNGAIEAAVIHARALLEFLGLKAVKGSATEITEREARKHHDDLGVEQFVSAIKLTREAALSAYPGPSAEAESALAAVFYAANKGLAHTTGSFDRNSSEARLLEIAFRGVPVLLFNGFYRPLGLVQPVHELTFRRRIA
ncbi:hypothetical protein [Acidovorax sp.]|uniref:hypothetical protein n=1 Tax=Acidovorax sp. TaxID=1872122 RepID=UPI0025BC2F2F|nr:hypothetical protein [Acidovorax sp.]